MLIALGVMPHENFMKKLAAGLGLFLCLGPGAAPAAPDQVIIIRHADKWPTKNPGPALDPTGYIRAVRFAYYFLELFGEPDFLIATDPTGKHDRPQSIRELQTLAPLANILAESPQSKPLRAILHPYSATEYRDVARLLHTEERFKHKKVLICWDHERIPELTRELGVKRALAEWPKQNFDDVYVIGYDAQGEVAQFEILKNQYPATRQTWKALVRPE